LTDAAPSPPILRSRQHLIAVVDDDPDILELVSVHLSREGMKVRRFPDAGEFYGFLQREIPDLIVLDLMLPDSDGMEVCRYLRSDKRFSAIPIIMLTAKAGEIDRVLGLEIGADDYVTKPFSPKELIARIRAVLRRSRSREGAAEKIEIGSLVIDYEKRAVAVEGHPVELTAFEFRILHLLASRMGRVFTREAILDHLWGQDKAVTDRTIDVHVSHLREKLGNAAHLVKNVRGVGYKVEP
jgi:DNA-binding response OmpR family regulator